MKTDVDKEKLAQDVYKLLSEEYPSARCTLKVRNPPHFLFANILSPQCTDVVANRVADDLWDTFNGPEGIASAAMPDIEKTIKPCGMYRVKAKNIRNSAKYLMTEYRGEVPRTLDELQEFPGIGRKTGLVILLEVYGVVDGIIVDTHNIRIAQRIGLTEEKDAVKIEQDLMKVVPREYWRMWSHLMVFHGRALCTARNPKCGECPVRKICAFGRGQSA